MGIIRCAILALCASASCALPHTDPTDPISSSENGQEKESKKVGPKIAVIGGGASGLTAAYLLKQLGYEKVRVFEKGSKVGGVTSTEKVDNQIYDISTNFLPGGSILGSGFGKLLNQMVDASGEKLMQAVDADSFDLNTKKLLPLFEIFNGFSDEEIKSQLVSGLVVSSKLAVCLSMGETCASCGVCLNENELLIDWGNRAGHSLYAHALLFTFDGLLASPSALFVPAASGLLSFFGAADVAYTLRNLGVTSESLPSETPSNIASLIDSQRWWFFKRGFQNFWDSLVKNEEIKVKLNSEISSLRHDSATKEWVLTMTTKQEKRFDMVVITTPPDNAIQFLPDGPQKELLSETGTPPPNDVFLARMSNFENSDMPDKSSWWPTELGQGTEDMANPMFGGTTKPIIWQKRHGNRDIILVGTLNLDPETTPGEAFEECKVFAETELGFTLEEQLFHKRYHFPAAATNRAEFNSKWNQLQGKDGLFVTGEAFSGSGVPAIASYANQVFPQYFPTQTTEN